VPQDWGFTGPQYRTQNVFVEEIALGGNLSASVRVGDTVRRRAGPWTPAVHALLAHFGRAGFPAPQPLGFDTRGRAMLAFLPGEVHPGWPDPLPSWMFEDEATLVAAARLLRRSHDSQAGFTAPPDARWRVVAPGTSEVICHNDWSPSNALFQGHQPIAMLDWDSAGPGTRAWDVAGAAYRWVPLIPTKSQPDLGTKATRFALFCAAYGEDLDRREVFDILPAQSRVFADFIQRAADAGDPGFAKLAGWQVPARLREEADLLVGQRDRLLESK